MVSKYTLEDKFLIEAPNYYNFAYPALWNYSFDTFIETGKNDYDKFLKYQDKYNFIITVKTHPASNEIQEYLENNYEKIEDGNFILFYKKDNKQTTN